MSEQSPAVKALLNYSQADMDGIIVTVSRQAIHEVVDELDTLRTRAETAEAELTQIKEAIAVKGGTEHAPTEWAYLEVCETLRKTKAERDAMRGVVEAARRLRDGIKGHHVHAEDRWVLDGELDRLEAIKGDG